MHTYTTRYIYGDTKQPRLHTALLYVLYIHLHISSTIALVPFCICGLFSDKQVRLA